MTINITLKNIQQKKKEENDYETQVQIITKPRCVHFLNNAYVQTI